MNKDKITKYGVPRKYVSCPGCGQIYGHHNTEVCENCEECDRYCRCNNKKMVNAKEFINTILAIL